MNKISAILTFYSSIMTASCSANNTTDPFSFDYSDRAAVELRLGSHITSLNGKAAFIILLKEVERFEIALLDPAAINEAGTIIESSMIEAQADVNRIKLGLAEVIEAKQDAPFCFQPNYRIIGFKNDKPVLSIVLSVGCGAYKAETGAIQFSDGFSSENPFVEFLNALHSIPSHDRDVTKVATENARRLLERGTSQRGRAE